MTGKELKEFANKLCDEAQIQVKEFGTYRHDWENLEAQHIRAVVVIATENEKEEETLS